MFNPRQIIPLFKIKNYLINRIKYDKSSIIYISFIILG